ncbi:hypothetical protein RRG08_045505 [Elysia crispata]|uniref:Uncharacterized protein n=1 Tax=Elysia crispata TaxID=231223 RepID=A0AAE1DX13_9GAST|nr:hypothetical protein RRG08_045505 [Elysia crispata]
MFAISEHCTSSEKCPEDVAQSCYCDWCFQCMMCVCVFVCWTPASRRSMQTCRAQSVSLCCRSPGHLAIEQQFPSDLDDGATKLLGSPS